MLATGKTYDTFEKASIKKAIRAVNYNTDCFSGGRGGGFPRGGAPSRPPSRRADLRSRQERTKTKIQTTLTLSLRLTIQGNPHTPTVGGYDGVLICTKVFNLLHNSYTTYNHHRSCLAFCATVVGGKSRLVSHTQMCIHSCRHIYKFAYVHRANLHTHIINCMHAVCTAYTFSARCRHCRKQAS